MKISKTGTALALAALWAACALPASAQVEMDGARELLGKIKQVRAAAPKAPAKKKPAETPAPAASEADWQKVLDGLKAKGKYTPERPPFFPGAFKLDDVIGDKDASHAEEHAAAMGALNDDELFEVVACMFVSETWTKNADGTWTVDRWGFETDVYGEVANVVHVTATADADRKPTGGKQDETLTTADPRIPKKYKDIIAHWSAPRP